MSEDPEEASSWIIICTVCLATLVATLWIRQVLTSKNPSSSKAAPLASPHVPIFGNALEYKKGPTQFLSRAIQECGPVFRVNLAGMQTTMVCSADSARQFAMCPESVLSAKAAVADIGFNYTLGIFNVERGADIHKEVIKNNYFSSQQLNKTAIQFCKHIEHAVKNELSKLNDPLIPDFLSFMRKILLSAIIEEMLGPHLLQTYAGATESAGRDFIEDFIVLQDGIEDATAAATVLPDWLALPVCLWSAQARRNTMVKSLAACLQDLWGSNDASPEGVWLSDMRQKTKYRKLPVESGSSGVDFSVTDVAELIVGLLFAAHKNAAIATAQTILYLLEEQKTAGPIDSLYAKVCAEAKRMQEYVSADMSNPLEVLAELEKCRVIGCSLRETLRLTAHSIGAMRKVVCTEGWTVKVSLENGDKKEYTIPQGSYVGASHFLPNVDPAIWGVDSLAFNPLRENVVSNFEDDYKFTTFSHGVHKCPGSRIALMVSKLIISLLLSKYSVELEDGYELPAVSFERATLAQRDGPCRVRCTPLAPQ